jgi:alpha-tubulin suppressor-like RCC1 family protein
MAHSIRWSFTALALVGSALSPLIACSDSPGGGADASADTNVAVDTGTVADTGPSPDGGADASPQDASLDAVADASLDAIADASPDGGAGGAAALSLGIEYSCARMTDGTARCWGENKEATLGDGTLTDRSVSAPVANTDGVGALKDVAQISAGYRRRTCVVTGGTSAGQVLCWGNVTPPNPPEGTPPTLQRLPAPLAGLTAVSQVHVGLEAVCARMQDATVQCWGRNAFGTLGDGTTTSRDTPAPVLTAGGASLAGVAQIAVGHHFACARMNDGTVQCWGSNSDGQLGDGVTPVGFDKSSTAPVVVAGLTGVTELAAGHRHACALAGGVVRCWGSNSTGQLGDGSTTNAPAPVTVTGLTGVGQLAIEGDGLSATTCARLLDGSARCWGANHRGQVGDGTKVQRNTPVAVQAPGGGGALAGVAHIAVGGVHACAVIAGGGGKIVCWGRNALGQLGDGTKTESALPVYVQ